ncbi:hypothetical protein [Streptomyces collinus]
MTKRVRNVVTNVGHYDDPSHPTGLWLSEPGSALATAASNSFSWPGWISIWAISVITM